MEALIPFAIAAVLAIVAWKVVKGVLKLVSFLAIVAVLGVLHWQGVY
jgi:hypothetical protein